MHAYTRNKIRTVWEIVQRLENWPSALALRIHKNRPYREVLRFRNGIHVSCRGGSRDWDVVHELFFMDSYGKALDVLRKATCSQPVVVDLGGNIGTFSLIAAATHPGAQIHAFEPGPPNLRMFEINRLLNPGLGERIRLVPEAVGGQTGKAVWFFDEKNPGASSLYASGDGGCEVQLRSLEEVVRGIGSRITLLKMDIEGAEYSVLEQTPEETWAQIDAIALEVHDDPAGKSRPDEFLSKLSSFGFSIEKESVVSFFLHRNGG
ncbi:MAG: FkbM family methyltransferase [Terrimicrobiaceae bacterium]|nr:FkbM family methyltransferase [Terrimicrobiaceae bacterium]